VRWLLLAPILFSQEMATRDCRSVSILAIFTLLPVSARSRVISAKLIMPLSSERPETPPQPSCFVPFPRDRDFVHRGALFDQIRERCAMPASRVALVGLGGVGYVVVWTNRRVDTHASHLTPLQEVSTGHRALPLHRREFARNVGVLGACQQYSATGAGFPGDS
jgi:hypothetical protein